MLAACGRQPVKEERLEWGAAIARKLGAIVGGRCVGTELSTCEGEHGLYTVQFSGTRVQSIQLRFFDSDFGTAIAHIGNEIAGIASGAVQDAVISQLRSGGGSSTVGGVQVDVAMDVLNKQTTVFLHWK